MNIATHGHIYTVRTEEGLAALLRSLSMLDALRRGGVIVSGLVSGVFRRLRSGFGHGDRGSIGLELAVRPDVPARVTTEVIDVAVSVDTFELPPWLIADRTNVVSVVRHRGLPSFSVSEGPILHNTADQGQVNSLCRLHHTRVFGKAA
jgi:hypothetical protein